MYHVRGPKRVQNSYTEEGESTDTRSKSDDVAIVLVI